MKRNWRKTMTKISTYLILIASSIGIYPIFQISAGTLVCKSSNNVLLADNLIFNTDLVCFGAEHLVNILSFIGIVFIQLFIMKTGTMSFFDPNPLSKQPYARMVSDSYILRAIPSMLAPVFSVLDYYGQIKIYTLIFFAIIFYLEIMINVKHPDHYKNSTSKLNNFTSCLKLGVFVSVILNYVKNHQNSSKNSNSNLVF